jgi:hypothetical protein
MNVLKTNGFEGSDKHIETRTMKTANIQESGNFDFTKVFWRSDQASKSRKFVITEMFDLSNKIKRSDMIWFTSSFDFSKLVDSNEIQFTKDDLSKLYVTI